MSHPPSHILPADLPHCSEVSGSVQLTCRRAAQLSGALCHGAPVHLDLYAVVVDVKQLGGTLQGDHAAPEMLLSQPEVEAERGGLQTGAVVLHRVNGRPPAARLRR